MPFQPSYENRFTEGLSSLDRKLQERVKKKIEDILEMPERFKFLHKAKGIQKARVGKWRLLFRVEGNAITFYRIGKRESVYAASSPNCCNDCLDLERLFEQTLL
jgi:mRNA-degrading endonuclease RelE of RelBE toxin-antitoxin system